MNNTILLELVSPDRLLLSEEVEEVVVPGLLGDIGILPGHTPLLTSLRVGEISYAMDGDVEYIALENGFLEISDDKIVILAESAELGREIDLEEAIKRKLEAEKVLEAVKKEDVLKFKHAEIALKRELLKISVAEKYKK